MPATSTKPIVMAGRTNKISQIQLGNGVRTCTAVITFLHRLGVEVRRIQRRYAAPRFDDHVTKIHLIDQFRTIMNGLTKRNLRHASGDHLTVSDTLERR